MDPYAHASSNVASRFRIEREIADTLQGRIYAGTDLITKKPVVIKEAWRQLVHSKRSRKGHRVPEDFLKERRLVMTLSKLADCSEGLVRGIAEWDDEHCYYYAMEYCEGELFDYISKAHSNIEFRKFVASEAQKPQIPMSSPNEFVTKISKMFKQICVAVQWLHRKGYCHLDLSLENTMISNRKYLNVKVIDLGLTQKFDLNNFRFQGRVGKLQYMCPEAYARQPYDARAADVYCLGVMLFMMLIGAPPYQVPQPQNSAFNYIINGRVGDVLKHWKRLRLVTVDALDLLNKILRYEPHRITLDEILAHPFLSISRNEQNDENVQQITTDASTMTFVQNTENEKENENDKQNNVEHKPQVFIEDHKSNENINDTNYVNPPSHKQNIYNHPSEEQKDNIAKTSEKKPRVSQTKSADILLTNWGLGHCAHKLYNAGWSQPNQWFQLTENVLIYEIGFTRENAQQFVMHYRNAFQTQPQKPIQSQTIHTQQQQQPHQQQQQQNNPNFNVQQFQNQNVNPYQYPNPNPNPNQNQNQNPNQPQNQNPYL